MPDNLFRTAAPKPCCHHHPPTLASRRNNAACLVLAPCLTPSAAQISSKIFSCEEPVELHGLTQVARNR